MAANSTAEKRGPETETSEDFQKLMKEASELRESLRLERSRNADMDRELIINLPISHVLVCYIYMYMYMRLSSYNVYPPLCCQGCSQWLYDMQLHIRYGES